MATEEAKMSEEAQEVQRRINRDLNCLSDENRGTRRGALNKLNRVFFSKRVVRDSAGWRVCYARLHRRAQAPCYRLPTPACSTVCFRTVLSLLTLGRALSATGCARLCVNAGAATGRGLPRAVLRVPRDATAGAVRRPHREVP